MKKILTDSEKFILVRREAIFTGIALVALIIFTSFLMRGDQKGNKKYVIVACLLLFTIYGLGMRSALAATQLRRISETLRECKPFPGLK